MVKWRSQQGYWLPGEVIRAINGQREKLVGLLAAGRSQLGYNLSQGEVNRAIGRREKPAGL